jgi:hypothetical protein
MCPWPSMLLAKQYGTPLVLSRDGQVVHVEPESAILPITQRSGRFVQ